MGHAKPWGSGLAGSYQRLWIDDDGRPWLVTARFARVDGRQEVVGMDVRSVREDTESERLRFPELPTREEARNGAPAARVTSTLWREVGTLVKEMREDYVRGLAETGLLGQADSDVQRAWVAPRERSREQLEEVAAVYRAAKAAGENTAAAVAARFFVSESAARKRIQRAREAGALPPAERTSKSNDRN